MKQRLYFTVVALEVAILLVLVSTRLLWPVFRAEAGPETLSWTHEGDTQLPPTAFEVDPMNYLLKWDRDVLFHYRLAWADSSPTIKGYLAGRALTVYLSPMQNLGGWEKGYLNDIAVSPTGEVVLLTTVVKNDNASKKVSQLLLVYDASGQLERRVDCAPYEYSAIAVDDHGELFAFGYKIGATTGEDFPMVIKLSLRGEVLGGFHARSLHNLEADPTSTIPFGPPKLFVRDNRVGLWVGNTGDLFEYDFGVEPRLVRHISLKEQLLVLDTELWTKVNSEIDFIGRLHDDKLLIQVRTTKDLGEFLECSFRLYEINNDGHWTQITTATATPQPGRVLGLDSKGNIVSIRLGPNRERLLSTYTLH